MPLQCAPIHTRMFRRRLYGSVGNLLGQDTGNLDDQYRVTAPVHQNL